jgi:zinc transport system substrate-binding protein
MKRKLGYLLSVMMIMSLMSYGIITWNKNSKVLNEDKVQGASDGLENESIVEPIEEQVDGSDSKTAQDSKEELEIVTSFYPMYIATLNLIDGIDGVTVLNLTENQTGCVHDYQLTTKDMRELVEADIAIINGGELEEFMEDVLADHPELKVITASEGIEFLEGTEHSHEGEVIHEEEITPETSTEESTQDDSSADKLAEVDQFTTDDSSHGEEGHDHSAINGHVWMNMDLYQQQIATIAKNLSKYDPDHASIYEENSKIYIDKIEALQKEFDGISELAKGKEIIIFHDAFAYLAQQLRMEVIHAVDTDSESALSAGEIGEVIEEVNLHSIQYLFTEAQYSTKIADRVATETSAKVYVMDSLVTGVTDKDAYLDGMRANLEMLKKALN